MHSQSENRHPLNIQIIDVKSKLYFFCFPLIGCRPENSYRFSKKCCIKPKTFVVKGKTNQVTKNIDNNTKNQITEINN